MNDQQFENKVRQDAANVKKDLNTLINDGVFQVNKIEDKVSQAADKAKDDVTSWAKDGAAQLNKGYKKLKEDARETVVDTAARVKKNVGDGLSQYNAKAQDIADRVPGGLGEKAARYPWVSISIALGVGLLLGGLLKSSRKFPK